MNTVFIYALNCPITGRTRYVGKTDNLLRRFRAHLKAKDVCRRTNWIKSLAAQGLTPVMEVLNEVAESDWPQWEVAWIEFFRESDFDLVNGNNGGEGGQTGKTFSPESRVKISVALTGNVNAKGVKASEETRAKLRLSKLGEKNPSFGKTHSKEHCAKIGAAVTGEKNGFFGKKHSAEALAKNSAAHSGNNHPQFGKPQSPETRAKIGAAAKLRHQQKQGIKI